MDIWKTLGIKRTKDISEIKRAYAEKAKEVHPEEDPTGFNDLHNAYTSAMRIARSSSQTSFELTNKNDNEVIEVNSLNNEHVYIFQSIGHNEKVISQLLNEILDYRKSRKERSKYVSEILNNEKFFDYVSKSPVIQKDFFAIIELECLKQKDIRRIRKAFTNYFKNNIPAALKPTNVFLNSPTRESIQWLFMIPFIAFVVSIVAAFAFAGVNSSSYLLIGYILTYLGLMIIWAVSSFGKRIKFGKISRYEVEKKMGNGLLNYYFTQGICFVLASLLFFNMNSLDDKFYITDTVFLGLQMSTFASDDVIIQFGFFSIFFTMIICYVIYLAVVSSGRASAQKEYYDPYSER